MTDGLYYYCSIEGSEVCGIPRPSPYAAAIVSWSDDYWKIHSSFMKVQDSISELFSPTQRNKKRPFATRDPHRA